MNSGDRPAGAFAAAGLVALFLASFVFAESWILFNNTLVANGNWLSSKLSLGKGVMGAVNYMHARNTLDGAHVNLGAWHGYQELLSSRTSSPSVIRFDARIPADAHFSLIFGADGATRRGLRFSAGGRFSNIYFEADAAGRFRVKAPLGGIRLAPDEWNRIEVELSGRRAVVKTGDGASATVETPRAVGPGRLGFRGGAKDVLIDNVEIVAGDGTIVFRDDFGNRQGLWTALVASLAMLLAGFMYLKRSARRAGASPTIFAFRAFGFGGACLVVAACVYGLVRATSAGYPAVTAYLIQNEAYWKNAEARKVRAEILAQNARDTGEGPLVMFVGSSQTWGAGASAPNQTFVSVFEREIRARRPVRVVNAAFPGGLAVDILIHYIGLVGEVKPDLVMVHLCNNDRDTALFRKALRRLARENRDRGIRTCFVLEANSSEIRPGSLPMHPVMRGVAEEEGIPLIDLHEYLKLHDDDGFLWWDVVHLTSFGHELAGKYLAGQVPLDPA